MTSLLPFPIGTSDFEKIRLNQSEYVDKTLLIAEIVRDHMEVLLFSRPRRFGKTLNLSMLRYFFDNRLNGKALFKGLAIESCPEFAHQGQYPTIFVTFKDVKEKSFAATLDKLQMVLAKAYDDHEYLLQSNALNQPAKALFKIIQTGQATQTQLEESLRLLSDWLQRHHQKPVVILMDEYDSPIHAAYVAGYYQDLIGMMRNLMGAAFKDNAKLFKGIITGILRISKEGMFSGLNNIKVYSLLSDRFAQYFGFTQQEVDALLIKVNRSDLHQSVRDWYNGFQFGNCEIYNPWSIINFFVDDLSFKPYWIGTSDNALVKQILVEGSGILKTDFETLMRGGEVVRIIDEYIILPQLFVSEDTAFSLLLFSGYLKVTHTEWTDRGYRCTLRIPNREIKSLFNGFLQEFFNLNRFTPDRYKVLLQSLVQGDIEVFSESFERYLAATFSYFDVSNQEPERFYHGFVLGLLVSLQETHEVRSNRESGYGRYDVMIIPKDKNQLGTIIEFKVVRKLEDLERGLELAFQQIADKGYAVELKALGITQIQTLAMVFCGKEMQLGVRAI